MLFFSNLHGNHRGQAAHLGEVGLHHVDGGKVVDIPAAEDFRHFVRGKLLVEMVGYAFHGVAHVLPHFRRQVVAVVPFQQVADAAFARLGIDADDVGLVLPSHIRRVDGQIRDVPAGAALFLPPFHALGDGVLMGAGKGRENQSAGIGLALAHLHAGDGFIGVRNSGQVGKVQPRLHPLGVHVHSQGDDVHVAGALPIAEQGPFHPFRPGQQRHFRVRHGAAPVVVRVEGENDVFPVF